MESLVCSQKINLVNNNKLLDECLPLTYSFWHFPSFLALQVPTVEDFYFYKMLLYLTACETFGISYELHSRELIWGLCSLHVNLLM
jgi:hypothetical protein